jgi:alpha-beta hydrolase superfamily lysophospholipase
MELDFVNALSRTPSRRHGVRFAVMLAVPVVAASVLVVAAWRYSDMILMPERPPTLREQRVLATEPGRVRLSRDRESLQAGTWALEWEGGFGRIGPVLASDDSAVVREFRPVIGEPPVPGWASLRGVSRSADPLSLLGLSYESVTFDGPLGHYPAWFVPGPDSTWVVYVHGRGANRADGLRTLGVLAARGLPGLLLTYRNDLGAPASPDGYYHLGLTEWEDLEAAVRYALEHGARDVVLSGYSFGGQIAMQFMSRSLLAARVRAVVMESPVLDWNATLEHRALGLGVPALGTWLGKRAATARAGIDWNQLDRVAHAGHLTAPILIFHGLKDDRTPEAVSEAFARALPAQTTLIRVPGGNHVEAWNVDPARYSATVNQWFAERGIGRDSP